MKGIGVMALLVMVSVCSISAQTLEIEKGIVNKRLKEENLSQFQIQDLTRAWKKLVKENGGYPEIPYNNKSELVEYEFIEKVPAANRESILLGIKEYAAMSDESFASEIAFDDANSGRVILKAWYSPLGDLPRFRGLFGDFKSMVNGKVETFGNVECTFNIVFTVKQGVYKCEIKNIKYTRPIETYYDMSNTVKTEFDEFNIESFLPITTMKEKHWEICKDLIKETNKNVISFNTSLRDYLISRKDSFDF